MLELNHVSFQYAPGRGIVDASLRIQLGEVLGVIGENGAGKSTLLGLAAAALIPQSGTITLSVSDLGGRTRRFRSDVGIAYRKRVGYLTELAPVYEDLSVIRYLKFRAKLRGERFLRIRHRVLEAMERCGLSAVRQEQIASLSFGFRRRVALAEALLTLPPILVLDDPLAGIDASLQADLPAIIKDISARSHILISGHDPRLLLACCSAFRVIQKGHLLHDTLSAAEATPYLAGTSTSTQEAPPA